MIDNDFLLADRIQKIQSMNELYDLENNAYISYSGGKDSSVLSKLFDLAIPDNNIPRVYINTGIEYSMMIKYVERERERDERIVIIYPNENIKNILEKYGYPFKSKEHSNKLMIYQHSQNYTKTIKRYLDINNSFGCPDVLKYQFTKNFDIKVSDRCCYKLKKEPALLYAKQNNKSICCTGMRNAEGGQRANKGCSVFKDGKLKKFHPLMPIEDDFIEWFINVNKIELCELYYSPFNFNRTGCKGCPYSINLQAQLDMLKIFLPAEEKQCEYIWNPIYQEYRKLNYRLDSQPLLF